MATEQRLIDANALIDGMKKRCNSLIKEYGSLDHYADGFTEAINYVENAPIVDAVPVVRCRDCKHWHRETISCEMNAYIGARERPCWYEDDFCSYGERRTDNG